MILFINSSLTQTETVNFSIPAKYLSFADTPAFQTVYLNTLNTHFNFDR